MMSNVADSDSASKKGIIPVLQPLFRGFNKKTETISKRMVQSYNDQEWHYTFSYPHNCV